MSTAETKTHYTPEDLLNLPDNGISYELVDGQLVERNMGWNASWIAGRLFILLVNFADERKLGWGAPPDASYQCFPDAPTKVRKPDASFICRGRLPGERFPEGHCPIAPDLAIEVLSPNDTAYEIDQKVREYLGAGVRLVWVVNPEQHTLKAYRADGSASRLLEKDDLSGEDVVPGFRIPVRSIFPPPEMLG